ncbi:MAG: hypothetical protein GY729_00630 [Desulfobacteraceae bacterium]|nr:hypothetical protein [Desulfobacteraceae bacterium]
MIKNKEMDPSSEAYKATSTTTRLFESIMKMSEEEQKDLLLLIGEQREHKRTPYLLQISYATLEGCFTDFILDISLEGVFLETIEPLFVGQKIDFRFNFKMLKNPVTITGGVAWKGVNGVGVKFLFKDKKEKEQFKDIIEKLDAL